MIKKQSNKKYTNKEKEIHQKAYNKAMRDMAYILINCVSKDSVEETITNINKLFPNFIIETGEILDD